MALQTDKKPAHIRQHCFFVKLSPIPINSNSLPTTGRLLGLEKEAVSV
jgi:hypothetical protein